jgi:outer membrane protein insertion porin family
MWYMNAELLFPLVKDAGLTGVIFFDAGNVYDDWDFQYIKKSVGGGVRWLSPMGPLRLEYGHVINPAADEGSGTWDFSIGAEF